jgi:TonB family protein
MKKATLVILAGLVLGYGFGAPRAVPAGDEALQSGKSAAGVAAAAFELKMRVLEGSREKAAEPAKPVTASFLKFLSFANIELEQDLAAEQQIKKVYNLKDVGLLTEANLVWEKGKSDKAFHMFRLNGQEYAVMVTPGGLAERNQFRIEVLEQTAAKKTSLLDTEFALPEKNAAVFGFETTELKPYFISLRVVRWSGEPAGAKAGAEGGVAGGVLGGAGAKVMPPKLVKQVEPVYPEDAHKAGIEGIVIMEATTDLYGRVADVKVLRSIPALDTAAVDAVKQWVYEPMVINGKPQRVTFTVTVRFKKDGSKKSTAGGVAGGVIGGVQGGVATGVEGGVAGGVEGGVKGAVEGGVAGGVQGGVAGAQETAKFEGDAVRAVGKIKPPKLVNEVRPVYPKEARRARVEGIVILEAKTDEQGNVVETRILRSIPVLDQAAIDAVRQWKYEPMVINGKPYGVVFTVTVRFTLDEGAKGTAMDKFAKGAVRAEGDIKPPKLLKEVQAVYPEVARLAEVQGVVILGVKTDETGKVADVIVLRSIPLLDQAAIDAVRQWVYEPFVYEGKATPVVFTVTVRFQLT